MLIEFDDCQEGNLKFYDITFECLLGMSGYFNEMVGSLGSST